MKRKYKIYSVVGIIRYSSKCRNWEPDRLLVSHQQGIIRYLVFFQGIQSLWKLYFWFIPCFDTSFDKFNVALLFLQLAGNGLADRTSFDTINDNLPIFWNLIDPLIYLFGIIPGCIFYLLWRCFVITFSSYIKDRDISFLLQNILKRLHGYWLRHDFYLLNSILKIIKEEWSDTTRTQLHPRQRLR